MSLRRTQQQIISRYFALLCQLKLIWKTTIWTPFLCTWLVCDRGNTLTNRTLGGNLTFYINNKLSQSNKLIATSNDPVIKLWRGKWDHIDYIVCIIFVISYCTVVNKPGNPKVRDIVARTHESVKTAEKWSLGYVISPLGDFNLASVKLGKYKQHEVIPTRKKTVEKL